MVFALAGNQNCGKTTLFNQLTGSNQHVGNFPGVTVDKKEGVIRGHNTCEHRHGPRSWGHPKTPAPAVCEMATVVDLPGIYSLSPYTSEEIVTRDFLIKEKPDGIINIVDATNIERNLYLSMQLIELNLPMVIALNMMDEMRANGNTVDVNKLEEELGVPVVPISAAKNEGIDELIEHALRAAQLKMLPKRQDFCSGAVHRCIHSLAHIVEDHAEAAGVPMRFAATKLVEGDKPMMDMLRLSENEVELIGHTVAEMEAELGTDREAALADMRYAFIEKLCAQTVVKKGESKEHLRSMRLDRVLTGKYTAIPIFLGIMFLIFWLTFGVIGTWLSDLLSLGIDAVTSLVDRGLTAYGINPVVHSLIIDGVFAGVGSVLSFLPIIVTLFFFLSILEDSGYMARVAFVMDKLLRKIGLSGRSFVPMLIGFGCSVPAIMATRTLESRKDRLMTMLIIPFMSCSARLPVYVLLISAFFPSNQGLVLFSIYLIGILIAIGSSILFKKLLFAKAEAPFVMELPPYRIPTTRNVVRHMWSKGSQYLRKMGTVILAASIIIWALGYYPRNVEYSVDYDRVAAEIASSGLSPEDEQAKLQELNDIRHAEHQKQSYIGKIGRFIEPAIRPLGFDWQIGISLFSGLAAKEIVVSTMAVLSNSGDDDASLAENLQKQVYTQGDKAGQPVYSPLVAYTLMLFILLYVPCIAAIVAIRREAGRKWAVLSVVYSTGLAWLLSFVVYQIGSWL